MTEVPIQVFRSQLSELLGRCRDLAEQFTVTVAGEAAAVLVNAYRFEAMVETLEILNDPKLVADLQEAENDAEVYTSAEVLSPEDANVALSPMDSVLVISAAGDVRREVERQQQQSDRQLHEDIEDDRARVRRLYRPRPHARPTSLGNAWQELAESARRPRRDDLYTHDEPVAGHAPAAIRPFISADVERQEPPRPLGPHNWTVETGSGRMTYGASAPAVPPQSPWRQAADEGWRAAQAAAAAGPVSAPPYTDQISVTQFGPLVPPPDRGQAEDQLAHERRFLAAVERASASDALVEPTVVQPTLPRPSFKDLSSGFDEPDLPDLCNRIARGMTTFSGYRRAWENLSPVEQKTVVDIAIAAIRIGNGNAGYSEHRRYWADLPSEIQNDAVREALRTWDEGNLYVGPTTRSPDVSEASRGFAKIDRGSRIDDEKVTRHRRKGLRELSSAVRQITGSRSDE